MTKENLFIKLAQPNENWISRWVNTSEFKWEYSELELLNWLSWWRKSSWLAKKFTIEVDKTQTPWVKIDRIRLNWFNTKISWTQHIRKDIKDFYKPKRCIILWTSNPEIDHKNGWKNSERVMNPTTQTLDDFQPLSKAANDAKRQHCKNCKATWIRFDAKKLWYTESYYEGNEKHIWDENWCIWCFWYDPIAFRKKFKSSWN